MVSRVSLKGRAKMKVGEQLIVQTNIWYKQMTLSQVFRTGISKGGLSPPHYTNKEAIKTVSIQCTPVQPFLLEFLVRIDSIRNGHVPPGNASVSKNQKVKGGVWKITRGDNEFLSPEVESRCTIQNPWTHHLTEWNNEDLLRQNLLIR